MKLSTISLPFIYDESVSQRSCRSEMKIHEVHSDGRVGHSFAVISVYVERSNVAVSGLDSGAQLYLEPNVLVLHTLLRTYEDMQTHKLKQILSWLKCMCRSKQFRSPPVEIVILFSFVVECLSFAV